ncbi:ThiF family adenylyltransferase [Dactylosporangium sp. CA-233914]|uniref:ThiF family adenylyltransferase n=1 Tax=Dactylosporangium sp. CA-233914 TaxID=3239934 RepID=UPI003D94F87A
MTDGQQLALRQLRDMAAARPGAIEIVDVVEPARLGATTRIDLSLNLAGFAHAAGGVRVRGRERFIVEVDVRFPYAPPSVWVSHRRWAGTPHVNWGRYLCLYAAPSVEWQPGDGMRGLLERLLLWLEKAAIGDLDPDDRPRHPPVAYVGQADELIVVRADLGDRVPWSTPDRGTAYLVAVCEQRGDRFDVIGWETVEEFAQRTPALHPRPGGDDRVVVGAAAVLVGEEPFSEYPDRAERLVAGLRGAGVDHEKFMELIAAVAATNGVTDMTTGGSTPLIVLVGTPSRSLGHGPRLAHLIAWRLDTFTEKVAELLTRVNRLDLPDLRADVLDLGRSWFNLASTDWLRLFEDRPEVTVRRDHASPAAWLAGKRILILGCGAVGGPVADACVRARATSVTVVDNGVVTPGILVRQQYTDADIGSSKAVALTARLEAISRTTTVRPMVRDAVSMFTDDALLYLNVDLIIDATADIGVRAAIEAARSRSTTAWPTVVTMLIGHHARRGLVALARSEATGAGHDIFRRLGLAVTGPHRTAFADVAEDFYPDPPRTATFQPEPGCSTPTFVGSAVEVTALAAAMFSAALDALANPPVPDASQQPMAVAAVRLDTRDDHPSVGCGAAWLGWPNDVVVTEQRDNLQVRISATALAEMRAETRRGARVRGDRIETGGMLIGALDEAAMCIYIDTASGPPPDSRLSDLHFEHGTDGAQQLIDHHLKRSRKASGFIGMWHTHPYGVAAPSPTDRAGMAGLVTPITGGPTQALMLILAGDDTTWTAWRSDATPPQPPKFYAALVRRTNTGSTLPPIPAPEGLTYYPGGYRQSLPAAANTARRRWWRLWHRRPASPRKVDLR